MLLVLKNGKLHGGGEKRSITLQFRNIPAPMRIHIHTHEMWQSKTAVQHHTLKCTFFQMKTKTSNILNRQTFRHDLLRKSINGSNAFSFLRHRRIVYRIKFSSNQLNENSDCNAVCIPCVVEKSLLYTHCTCSLTHTLLIIIITTTIDFDDGDDEIELGK